MEFSLHSKYRIKVVPTGNRASSTNISFIVGVMKLRLLSHILPSVYRCLTFSFCYADRIFTISECCRDSFGEIVCSAAVTLVLYPVCTCTLGSCLSTIFQVVIKGKVL
jgi:hypothetical protein